MTPEQARLRFSEAFEDELSADERSAFDAALEANEPLREEYRAFQQTMRSIRGLATDEQAPPVDLLAGVQRKLRTRSRGRYYRDRYSVRGRGQPWVPIVVALVMLIAIGLAFAALHLVTIEGSQRGPDPPEAPSSPP